MQRWKTGCDGMIAVNSIFASFSGALVALVVAFTTKSFWVHVCVALLMLAFLLFVNAAETITDALEQNNVEVYLRSHMKYNLGVVLLLISLAVVLFLQGYRLVSLIPILGTIYPWLLDAFWLKFASEQDQQEYRTEILKDD